MTTATIADTLADQHRQTRQTRQSKYASLIRKTVTAGSLTDAELAELDELLAPLALTPEDVRVHTEAVQRHGQLAKDVAAGGLAEPEVREDREKIVADLKPHQTGARRAALLAQLDSEANGLRIRLKVVERRLSDLAKGRQELAAVEDEFGWLVTAPRAAAKTTPVRKGRR